MADTLSKSRRSWNMSRIQSKNTKPEQMVRSLLHRAGYRFTINGPLNQKLPGKPDLVLPKLNTVILVHGCFWHRHEGCKYAYTPKSRKDFWEKKFKQNQARDKIVEEKLKAKGWNIFVIWECEIKASPEEVLSAFDSFVEAMTPDEVLR